MLMKEKQPCKPENDDDINYILSYMVCNEKIGEFGGL